MLVCGSGVFVCLSLDDLVCLGGLSGFLGLSLGFPFCFVGVGYLLFGF